MAQAVFNRDRLPVRPYTVGEYRRDGYHRWQPPSVLTPDPQLRMNLHTFIQGEFINSNPSLKVKTQGFLSESTSNTVFGKLSENRNTLAPATRLISIFDDPGVYLAGGCILSAVFGEPVKDFDFFFDSRKTMVEFLRFLMADGYIPVAVTRNATTLAKDGCPPIQLINNHYYDIPEFCIMVFDWSVSQFAIFSNGPSATPYTTRRLSWQEPWDGLSFACSSEWPSHIRSRMIAFNGESLGSRRSSFFRALKYRQKYGLLIEPYGLENQTIDTEQLLRQSKSDDYTIRVKADFWTAPDDTISFDALGSLVDNSGSKYAASVLFHMHASKLLEAHRSSWSRASTRLICHELDVLSGGGDGLERVGLLPMSRALLADIIPNGAQMSYFEGQYGYLLNKIAHSTPDRAFDLLMKMVVSLEVAIDQEYEDITNGEAECLNSDPKTLLT